MRTLKQLIAACTDILINGKHYIGDTFDGTFEDEPAVILPKLTLEEDRRYFDDLVEHWYNQDYWYCFDFNEPIVGHSSHEMGYEVDSYRLVSDIAFGRREARTTNPTVTTEDK